MMDFGASKSEVRQHSGKDGMRANSTGSASGMPAPVAEILGRIQLRESENISEDTTKRDSSSESSEISAFEKYKEIERKRRIAAMYSATNTPKRHRLLKLESITHKEWLDAFEKVKARLGTGCILAIVGSRGTGKTQIATESIRAACKMGMDAYYAKAVDIFISMRACYRAEATSEERLIKAYSRYKLLVIDALEEKSDSEWENRMLSHIIDKRYDDMVDTILISNEKPEAFSAQHGSSIADRIYETGGIIECKWLSFRKK